MTRLEAIQAIKDGKKVRRKGSQNQNGYLFSYDGIMASVVTNDGETQADFKMIDDLVIPDTDDYIIVDAYTMPIEELVIKYYFTTHKQKI